MKKQMIHIYCNLCDASFVCEYKPEFVPPGWSEVNFMNGIRKSVRMHFCPDHSRQLDAWLNNRDKTETRHIKNMESLLQNIAAGLNRYDQTLLCDLEVLFYEYDRIIITLNIQTALDYLSNDIYFDGENNLSNANRVEIREKNGRGEGMGRRVDSKHLKFDFCTGCGADYIVFPTRSIFTVLREQGCCHCGNKNYKSMTAEEGIRWRKFKQLNNLFTSEDKDVDTVIK